MARVRTGFFEYKSRGNGCFGCCFIALADLFCQFRAANHFLVPIFFRCFLLPALAHTEMYISPTNGLISTPFVELPASVSSLFACRPFLCRLLPSIRLNAFVVVVVSFSLPKACKNTRNRSQVKTETHKRNAKQKMKHIILLNLQYTPLFLPSFARLSSPAFPLKSHAHQPHKLTSHFDSPHSHFRHGLRFTECS